VLGPDVVREYVHYDIALETEFEGALVDAMARCLKAEDPGRAAVPVHALGRHGRQELQPAGHALLRLLTAAAAADLDFSGMFHGVDERVPLDSLRFGVRVLDRFLDEC
jgi:acetylornithine deacetylase/succinyl-diaminopimelate desuccinylase-like protein